MKKYNLIYPTSSRKVTSPYGPRQIGDGFHDGLDFACEVGTKVLAMADGKVVCAKEGSSYGKFIIIQHDGFCTLYAHLSAFEVKVGQYVKQGDLIAKSGNTGVSEGPHIHLEVRKDNYSNLYYWRSHDGKFDNSEDPTPHLAEPWKVSALQYGEQQGWTTPGVWHANDQWDVGTILAVLQKFKESL